MDLVLIAGIFITVILLIEFLRVAFKTRGNPEVKRVRRLLKSLSAEAYRNEMIDIVRKRSLSSIPWLNRGLLRMQTRTPLIKSLDHKLQQADLALPLAIFLLLSLVMALVGFMIALLLAKSYLIALVAGATGMILPFWYVSLKKGQRIKRFERQLPEALDMISRALRAGHSFSSGIKMVSEEFDDPLGGEFGTLVSQLNVGVSFQDAIKSLAKRIDCPDLKFFAISLIIQRQSGGNLAEILENISRLIRERFKLRNQVKALAAEGKFSAIILIALPFFIVFALMIVSPAYISVLKTDPIGHILIGICLVMMAVGVMVMKKIIAIKV